MKSITMLLAIATTCCSVTIQLAAGPEDRNQHHVERRLPIEISLAVGEEKLLVFDEPVSVGVPPQLSGVLQVESINGVLYLQTDQAFPRTRIVVEGEESKKLHVVQLHALASIDNVDPIEVVNDERASNAGRHATSDPVALTRFAAQQLYAPSRLQALSTDIQRIHVDESHLELLRIPYVKSEPIAGWRNAELYVTALKLTNLSIAPIRLDPSYLRGQWETASFQNLWLQASGTLGSTAVIYLVSKDRFAMALAQYP